MLQTERLPDETNEEFKRRKNREKMRAYRAARKDPEAPIRRRGKNKGPGKNGTLTHEEWLELQPKPGESATEHKRRYARALMRRWRLNNKEKEASRRRQIYASQKDKEAERRRKYREQHPDIVKAWSRRHYEKNIEKKLAALKEWGLNNPERLREANKRWCKEHPDIIAANVARCRARAVQATPPWVDWKAIQKVYTLAAKITRQTGVEHQVDHIEPLAGKTVCGLHVPWNLRVIPAVDNMKKRNKRLEEMNRLLSDPA